MTDKRVTLDLTERDALVVVCALSSLSRGNDHPKLEARAIKVEKIVKRQAGFMSSWRDRMWQLLGVQNSNHQLHNS